MTHFLSIADHSGQFLATLLEEAAGLRQRLERGERPPLLAGCTLAMVFQKPSLRTRVSFEVAMHHLGGHAINLQPAEIGVGTREPARDVARVLGGMCDGIVARVHDHATLEEMARYSPVPVINGLSDRDHPVQALADALTIRDEFGRLEGRRVAYIGDANNVSRSLALICGRLGMPFVACGPAGYAFDKAAVAELRRIEPRLEYTATTDPREAARDADVIYTDTWTSMGQEEQRRQREADFAGYTVDADLLAVARPGAIVLHCLPAYRGLEISDEVIEGGRSRVFEQARNRLHAQKALLVRLLGSG